MTKAEEIHYKAVIAADNQEPPKDYCISAHADHFNGFVEGYVEGYQQAERDKELTWEDVRKIVVIYENVLNDKDFNTLPIKDGYTEVLKRFNKFKED